MSSIEYPIPMEYEPQASVEADQRSPFWLYFFIFTLLGFQFALIFPQLGPVRVLLRIGAYTGSIALLFALKGSGPRPSATKWAVGICMVVAISIIHPDTTNLVAGIAACMLYVATLAPLFWVPRIRVDLKTLKRVILIFWLFHAVSSLFGVLQIYHPGQYQPNIGALSLATGSDRFSEMYKGALSIVLKDGSHVLRPMGLTDSPGGAGISGMYTTLLGIGLLVQARNKLFMGCIIGAISLGLFCIYLCQIRTLFLMTGCAVTIFLLLYARIGEVRRALTVGAVMAALVVASFSWAVAVGGDSVTKRLGSLLEQSPVDVYKSNRGMSLILLVNDDIPNYPLGAGLGRWGMIWGYFSDHSQTNGLWSEIQWNALVYDGGVLLLVLYVGAIVVTLKDSWRIARSSISREFGGWGALLFAYSLAGVANTFDFPFFAAQSGMEFWFLNAILFAAYQTEVAHTTSALPELAL